MTEQRAALSVAGKSNASPTAMAGTSCRGSVVVFMGCCVMDDPTIALQECGVSRSAPCLQDLFFPPNNKDRREQGGSRPLRQAVTLGDLHQFDPDVMKEDKSTQVGVFILLLAFISSSSSSTFSTSIFSLFLKTLFAKYLQAQN